MKLSRRSLCAVAGDDVASATRPLAAPIYQSSVFDVESLELVEDLYQAVPRATYTPATPTPTPASWRGGLEAALAFVRAARLIRFAPSLGEVRTTLSHPARTSHRALTRDQREALGIGDGLIRLSCGIEDVADIVADIDQALAALRHG